MSENHVRSLERKPQWFALLLGLGLMGLIMVASSSFPLAERIYHDPWFIAKRQGAFFLVSVAAFFVLRYIPSEKVKSLAPLILMVSILGLVLVLLPGIGKTVNGSARWIHVFGFSIQPSEFAKVGFLIFLADFLSRRQKEVLSNAATLLKPIFLLGIVACLLLLEPDFGSTVVLTATVLSVLFLAGVRFRYFVILGLIAVILFGFLAWLQPYRMARLTSFLNPWADQYATGYQLTQALIAFGRGGLWGLGLGEGIQKQFYLPEAHTDFVLAIVGEELGLVGITAVIAAFSLLIRRGLLLAKEAISARFIFQGYLVYAVTLFFAYQGLISFGVNVGLLPTKGLTFPLLSYGGSSLLASAMALGLLDRIDSEIISKKKKWGTSHE